MSSRPPVDQQVTFLYARDLSASVRFYEELLGLELVMNQGACRIYRVAGEAFLGICEDGASPAGNTVDPRGVIVTLVSDEVDAWHDYLRARDAVIEKPPTLNERFDIYHLFLRDPDGYLVEIQRFGDPTWPTSQST